MRFGRPVRSFAVIVLVYTGVLWPGTVVAQSNVGTGPLTGMLTETERPA
jgi:hypothetical protein